MTKKKNTTVKKPKFNNSLDKDNGKYKISSITKEKLKKGKK